MKGIAQITRRLLSVLLVLVASGMMFLSSPAIAATSSLTTVNGDNIAGVVKSDKPVVVVLASKYTTEQPGAISLEELQSEAEKFFGDKFKIAVGYDEEIPLGEYNIPSPRIFPPLSKVLAFKWGELEDGANFISVDKRSLTAAFERIKSSLES